MYNTIDVELLKAIRKANKLGINVITDGSTPSAKCLSIIINNDIIGNKVQVFFDISDTNGETVSLPSPFTWGMTRDEFVNWVKVAYKQPLRRINQTLSKMVRMMPLEKFDKLRRIPDLERQVIKYLRDEFAFLGIHPNGISLPMLFHLEMIYGGLFNRSEGDEYFLDELFDMILKGRYIPDKCRSCKYCRHDNDGKNYCENPDKVFSLPMDTTIGNIITAFPDVQVRQENGLGYAYTKYIPEKQKTCTKYKRRF